MFVQDKRAVEYLNEKKTCLLDEISELRYRSNKKDYLMTLEKTVSILPNVGRENPESSLEWNNKLQSAVNTLWRPFQVLCKLKKLI